MFYAISINVWWVKFKVQCYPRSQFLIVVVKVMNSHVFLFVVTAAAAAAVAGTKKAADCDNERIAGYGLEHVANNPKGRLLMLHHFQSLDFW